MLNVAPQRFEDGRPMLLGGLRRRHAFAAAESGVAEQWRQFQSQPEIGGRVGQNLYGVMCGADSTGFEYLCGVEVESLAALADGTGRMRVPGGASTLRSTWQQILSWLASGAYASAHKPDFELYPPGTDPLTASDTIEVWVGVVSRDSASEGAHG
jgi:AraC family transcriptional regulator